MHIDRTPTWNLWLSAIWLCVGCQNSPRNGQPLPNATDPVQFSGYTSEPSDTLTFQIQNQSAQSWVSFGYGTTSSASPWTDAAGVDWYEYSMDTPRLPSGTGSASYWRKASTVSGQRRIRADVRTFSLKGKGPLYSFDYGSATDQCIAAYGQTGGGAAVLEHCKSAKSPEAELFVSCGKPDQDCCAAFDISSAQRCDAGRLCSSSSRCTIPSGGLNQPCNGDGTCNNNGLGCIKNVCRDIALERMPLYTLDLQVKTCSDTTWVNNSSADLFLDLNGVQVTMDTPADDLKPGATNTFGVRPQGISRLGDIRQIEIRVLSDKWCIDDLKLIANGQTVFQKTYSSPLYLNPLYPFGIAYVRVARDDLRDAWWRLATNTYCQAPSQISGAGLDRMIEGSIIDMIKSSSEIDGSWGSGGGVSITRKNADTMRVNTTFRANPQIDGVGRIGVTVSAEFEITFTCASNAINVATSSIDITDVDGGIGYDILNAWSLGIVDFLAEGIAQSLVDEQSGALQDSMGMLSTAVPICPILTVTTTTPPNLTFQYPNPASPGTFITPSLIDVCRLP